MNKKYLTESFENTVKIVHYQLNSRDPKNASEQYILNVISALY